MSENLIYDDISRYIRRHARDQRLSLSQLAEDSRISRQTLYKIMEGDAEAKLSTIIRLSGTLQVHPLDMMRAFFGSQNLPVQASATAKYPLDASSFIEDVTVPDNMRVWINQRFIKTWKIQNTGKRVWQNRRLVCMDPKLTFEITNQEEMEVSQPALNRRLIPAQDSIAIPLTRPGQTIELSVEFTTPTYPGTQISYWKMIDEVKDYCFPEFEGLSCLVQVISI